jgi:hypothetical protein
VSSVVPGSSAAAAAAAAAAAHPTDGPLALSRSLLTPDSAAAAAFQWFDHWWSDARCDPKFTRHGWDESGSTAVISMVAGHQLVVANAGGWLWPPVRSDSLTHALCVGFRQRLDVCIRQPAH